MTGAALTDFYTRCQKVRSLFKKSKENAEGIFGSEELYDISSEVSYSEAMANMKLGMQRFANAAGKDIAEVFNGLTEYNIERTYLMAKNIMESNRVKNEYAYYDIGTNIITYTP